MTDIHAVLGTRSTRYFSIMGQNMGQKSYSFPRTQETGQLRANAYISSYTGK